MREGMRKATQRESRARLLIPLIRPSIAPEAFITLPIMVIRAIEMSRVRPPESMTVSCSACQHAHPVAAHGCNDQRNCGQKPTELCFDSNKQ